jgi:hypothetical protein
MVCFHNFTVPVREIFFGNLSFFFCSLFYLVWWIIVFRPGSAGGGKIGWACLAAAFVTGIAALALMAAGINALSPASKGVPVWGILLGGILCYFILLPVTAFAFHRQVTSELLIMDIWAVMQLCCITVLRGTGHLGEGGAAALTVLVGLAAVAGLVCYILYYRVSGAASWWDGMIPLLSDALVMAVFLGVMAVS